MRVYCCIVTHWFVRSFVRLFVLFVCFLLVRHGAWRGVAWRGMAATDGCGDGDGLRAGHATAWDEERGGMWLHGGYTTFFPYISSDGAGSDFGITVSLAEGERGRERERERESALGIMHSNARYQIPTAPHGNYRGCFSSVRPIGRRSKTSRHLPESKPWWMGPDPQRGLRPRYYYGGL